MKAEPIEKGIKIVMDRLPVSINQSRGAMFRNGRMIHYPTKVAKEFKKELQACIPKDFKLLEGKLQASLKICFPTKRKADIQNYDKVLFDSLSGLVYEDDSQIFDQHNRKEIGCGKAETVLIIQEIE